MSVLSTTAGCPAGTGMTLHGIGSEFQPIRLPRRYGDDPFTVGVGAEVDWAAPQVRG